MDNIIYYCEDSLFATRKKVGLPYHVYHITEVDMKVLDEKMFNKTSVFSIGCLNELLDYITAYEF